MTDRKSRRILAKAGIALTATVLALFLGELAVRVLGRAPEIKTMELDADDCVYKRSTNAILGFELKADYRAETPDFIASYERTNSHGQRDKERSLQKKKGTRRILLLGDSVVEGHGLAEADTISAQWEKLYTDGNTEVLNFGVSAYCTLAEIELLETKGLAFHPDIVVVLFVENDFDNFNREAFALGSAADRPAAVNWLFRTSHLFRLTSLRLDLFQFAAEADPARWNKEAIGDNNVIDGFKRLRQLADQEGFQPLIAIWPRFLDDQVINTPTLPDSDETPIVEQLAALHGLPSARLSEVYQADLRANPGNPRLKYTSGDSLHPSPNGAAIAAGALAELVTKLESGELSLAEAKTHPNDSIEKMVATLGASQPDYARVYHRKGVAHLKRDEHTLAIEQFQRALKEDPNHAGSHANLGIAYEKTNQKAKAKVHYSEATRLQSDFAQAHFNLANLLLAEGSSAEAIASLQSTLQANPNHTDALNLLGMEMGKAGRFPEAQALLLRAIKLEPDFSEAHNNLATVFAASGDLDAAIVHFKEAIRADPDNQGARARLKQVEQMRDAER